MATKSMLRTQMRGIQLLNATCKVPCGGKNKIPQSLFKASASSLSQNTETHEKYIYKSPWQDITVPDLSVIDYLKQKCKGYDDRVAMVSVCLYFIYNIF